MIAWFGSGWAILSNAITYLAFIAGLLLLDAGRLRIGARAARAAHQIRDAVTYVRNRSEILLVLCVVFCVGTFGMNFQLTSALMAQQDSGSAPSITGCWHLHAVGSLAGALVAARRPGASSRFVVIVA